MLEKLESIEIDVSAGGKTNDMHVKEDIFMHMGLTFCIKNDIF